jgi:ribonucleoside-diphosphate reductase alpha chain
LPHPKFKEVTMSFTATSVESKGQRMARKGARSTNGRSSHLHGLVVEPVFCPAEVADPFDTVEWDRRTAAIKDESGKVLFEQTDAEVPKSWSQLAANVVVSKYFYGEINTPEREQSVRQVIHRVTRTIADWGIADGYFATPEDGERFYRELTWLCLHQCGAFNSPVWFNVGLFHQRGVKGASCNWHWDAKARKVTQPENPYEHPQASACFIQSVQDDMESIMGLARSEAMLFKFGSGTGTDLSTLRSHREKLSGGGKPSGPLSFMRVYDQVAAVVKCVTADTYLYTADGIRRIGDVIGEAPFGFSPAERLDVATPEGRRTASQVFVGRESPIRRMTLRWTGLELSGTHEHPVLVLTPDFRLVWKPLRDVEQGDRVAVDRTHGLWSRRVPDLTPYHEEPGTGRGEAAKQVYHLPAEMTLELARLLGYLAAEGTVDGERIRFCNADLDVFADFVACFERVFGAKIAHGISSRTNPKTGVVTHLFSASWHYVARFLVKLGAGGKSADKRIPQVVLDSPQPFVTEFLRGYFEGDGHVGRNIYVSTKSCELARQLQVVLLNYGMISHRRSGQVKGQTYWRVLLCGANAEKFLDQVGFISQRKREARISSSPATNYDVVPHLLKHLRSRFRGRGFYTSATGETRRTDFGGLFHRKGDITYSNLQERLATVSAGLQELDPDALGTLVYVMEKRFLWDEVREIVEAGTAVTYDLTVPDVHAFATNGIVSHNSGGKTRRAAKMQSLKVTHPDVMEFIECKAKEEKKARVLIENGYESNFNGDAYSSILFQNANLSVRVTDEFMQAAVEDKPWTTRWVTDPSKAGPTYQAREVLNAMAQNAWYCGDPGVQYDSTINRWHTCPNSGRINASNPCVTGDTLVATSDGYRRIREIVGQTVEIINGNGQRVSVDHVFRTGRKPVFELKTRSGFALKLTADHRVKTVNRGDVAAVDLTIDDIIQLERPGFGIDWLPEGFAELLGAAVGDGCITHQSEQDFLFISMGRDEHDVAQRLQANITQCQTWLATGDRRAEREGRIVTTATGLRVGTSVGRLVDKFHEYAVLDCGSVHKRFTDKVFTLDKPSQAGILRALFTADGTVANYGPKSQYVALDSVSLVLLRQVQLLLLGFGIKAKLYQNRRAAGQTTAFLPDGKGGMREYDVQQIHSLRISRSSRVVFEQEIGLLPESVKAARLGDLNRDVRAYRDKFVDRIASLTPCGEEDVYDLTEPQSHHFVANGIVVHNCSEYMFLDDTACNLASVNLMKFRREDGTFDIERFKAACRVFFIAQEILVDHASYPTAQIAENSHLFRPLGLGYSNLGSLLMTSALPYDSPAALGMCGALTAILHGAANLCSAELAAAVGPFEGYEPNREPMLHVMQMHRDAVERIDDACPAYLKDAARGLWDEVLSSGRRHGFRNAQATVLAPTGTISFMMDCDTTGIEPDIALVKYKQLAGGGMLKIVNRTVPLALEALGYDAGEIERIVKHIDEHDKIEDAQDLKAEHLGVFDCAFEPRGGGRSIPWHAHVRMMGAAQPFISGAISKTVNMPRDTTPEDIANAYLEGWRLGLKALAIYRDGSKESQPLSTSTEKDKAAAKLKAIPRRERLPDTRQSVTHKFSVAGHEGYITVGLYEDGRPGELFITMAKEGSTVGGLMDCFGTAISICLQYGVPLEVLVNKFSHTRFEPMGHTPNPDIRIAKSLVDYIFRWLGNTFLAGYREANAGLGLPPGPGASPVGRSGTPPEPAGPSPEEPSKTPSTQTKSPPPQAPKGGGGAGGPHGGPQHGSPHRAANGVTAQGYTNGHADGEAASTKLLERAGVAPKFDPLGSLAAYSDVSGYKAQFASFQVDAPPCDVCGNITVRTGNCYLCHNCGNSMGCS